MGGFFMVCLKNDANIAMKIIWRDNLWQPNTNIPIAVGLVSFYSYLHGYRQNYYCYVMNEDFEFSPEHAPKPDGCYSVLGIYADIQCVS
jgi:hypothetical protein